MSQSLSLWIPCYLLHILKRPYRIGYLFKHPWLPFKYIKAQWWLFSGYSIKDDITESFRQLQHWNKPWQMAITKSEDIDAWPQSISDPSEQKDEENLDHDCIIESMEILLIGTFLWSVFQVSNQSNTKRTKSCDKLYHILGIS